MKSIIQFTLLLAVMAFGSQVTAQEGTIILEISDVKAEGDAAQFAEMMRGTQTEVFYRGEESAVKMNMMGGMVNIKMHQRQAEGMDMLLDAMGQKIWVNSPPAELMKQKMSAPEMDITYDKSDTKTIAGFDCYKMMATIDGPQGESQLTGYITEDLKIDAQVMQGIDMSQFAGFPLEYTMVAGPVEMTITTKEFSKEIADASVFEINTSGYQKMSMEELQNMAGGMGFGF
ncbi:MAG: hypothetical protein AAFQ02_06115 [Bacteroidota bacterium]